MLAKCTIPASPIGASEICRLRRSCILVRLANPSSVMPELHRLRYLSLVKFWRYPSPVSVTSFPVRKRLSSWGKSPIIWSPASVYVIPRKKRRFSFMSGRKCARPVSDSWARFRFNVSKLRNDSRWAMPASVNVAVGEFELLQLRETSEMG